MKFDPLRVKNRKQPRPTRPAETTPAATPGSDIRPFLRTLFNVVCLGLAVFVAGQRQGWWDQQGDDGRQDDQEQVEPVTKADGWIVLIHERTPLQPSHVSTLDDAKAVADSIEGLGWRSIDDDDPAAKPFIEFAEKKGVKPPMIVWRSADGKFRNAKPWPADQSEIKAVLR